MTQTSESGCIFIATSWGKKAVPEQFFALAQELATRNYRVVLLIDGCEDRIESAGTNPSVYSWPSFRPTRLRDAFFFVRLVRQFRPDMVVANFVSTNVMLLVGWLLRVRFRINWYHSLTAQINIDREIAKWKVKLLRVRKRLVYRAATHFVPVSEAAFRDLTHSYGVPSHKCKVFYNSLADPGSFDLLSAGSRRTGAVCVGRLRPSKGQDVLIRAIAHLKQDLPETRVEFVGDGPSKGSFMKLARELGVEESCLFAEPVEHQAVLDRMTSSVATLVPSRDDNCPLVVIESLAVGTPVIGSNVGGIVEMIRDGVEGFLVEPDDPAALAEKLKLILLDKGLRDRMGRNARARFLEFFEQKRSLAEQVEWFERLMEGSAR
jgi:glycosyltransferase involved in cell wall biosynthesis